MSGALGRKPYRLTESVSALATNDLGNKTRSKTSFFRATKASNLSRKNGHERTYAYMSVRILPRVRRCREIQKQA